MKSFESWSFEDIEIAFSIERVKKHKLLTDWISTQKTLSDFEKRNVDNLLEQLCDNVETWNEDELKMQFIGPLLSLVNFNTGRYKSFTQRSLTLKTDTVETSGLVDLMVATGKARPREPFFFLHEYKAQHPSKKNDPLGQLLIAMVAAQLKNDNAHPVYGVLIEGRLWYFVVLQAREYVVCQPFDAGSEDIYQIFTVLCKVKDFIDSMLAK